LIKSREWSLHKMLDKMLLIIINSERNKRFPEFFSSHRIMFVSLWGAQLVNYFLWAFLWLKQIVETGCLIKNIMLKNFYQIFHFLANTDWCAWWLENSSFCHCFLTVKEFWTDSESGQEYHDTILTGQLFSFLCHPVYRKKCWKANCWCCFCSAATVANANSSELRRKRRTSGRAGRSE